MSYSPADPYQSVQPVAQPPPRRGMSTFVKCLIGVAIAGALGVVALIVVFVYVGNMGPATQVLGGRQVPARFIEQIKKLDVLEPDEKIAFFYSDALLNIEDGFYLLTDRHVVIYSHEYEEPALVIPFSEIAETSVDYSDSWVEDTLITLVLKDGSVASFPASTEGGGDKRMYNALLKKCPPDDS